MSWCARREPANNGVVLVEVIDHGIGIPDADVEHVFDRFFQVDNTATRRFGGTGMGLALVKRVVDAHGATIEIAMGPGSGRGRVSCCAGRSGAQT